MYTLYKLTVKFMYTLYNDLTNFSKKNVKSVIWFINVNLFRLRQKLIDKNLSNALF